MRRRSAIAAVCDGGIGSGVAGGSGADALQPAATEVVSGTEAG